jgi:small subunit ribosomal protein S23e
MQDEVLIAGFGRRGHAVGDIPGVRFKVCRSVSAAEQRHSKHSG